MPLLVLGLNHRTSDLALLERVSVPPEERRKALRELTSRQHVLEAIVVSTCNRIEVYAHLSRFHEGLDEVAEWLASRAGDLADVVREQYELAWDLEVAEHLFRVVGGLDSMVVGERQIAMQVRDAMEVARAEGTAAHLLLSLFRQAVRVGRRLQRETDVNQGASSMVDVALDSPTFGVQVAPDTTALVVGAGTMGSLTAERLADRCELLVWNRSRDKAQRLADRHHGVVVDDLARALAAADLVICTTGAVTPLITPEHVGARPIRPLTILDLAMPHNVERAVGELAGVRLLGIDQVRVAAEQTLRDDVIASTDEVVAQEVQVYHAWWSAREVTPVIRALRDHADDVRVAELARFEARLAHLDDDARNSVEALTLGIVNTLLHRPTVRLKERADEGRAQGAVDVLRDLLGLELDADDQ